MNPALAAVLSNPAIWRGGECAPEPAALPSGFPALDAMLPGRGWPSGALTEIMLEREGIGELRLTLPALAQLQAEGRDIAWIAPPHVPYAPALIAAGLDLARLFVVRCRSSADQLWAYEQALRAPECGAAFAWLGSHDERPMRRLAVAAREGLTWGVLWRRPGQRAIATTASLRLSLAPRDSRLAVRVLKRRGGDLAQPALIDVDAGIHHRLAHPDPRMSAAGPSQGANGAPSGGVGVVQSSAAGPSQGANGAPSGGVGVVHSSAGRAFARRTAAPPFRTGN